ncbi:MAG TPA: HAD family hydrolase [Fimbriiglobus sp.]|jgi:D-glycero-D-manno-heptose 1,7-bisphosphate phosphatase|nr:HAD family hydrolase [Fimbriiglobus sp.]
MPADEAVFLDRDGTLIEEVNYLSRVEQVRLIPGAAAAVRRVNEAGVRVVVVTNQAGVARGYFPESRVAEVHAHLSALLSEQGAHMDAYYYCPHHAAEGVGAFRVDCDCRKPKPGMLRAAAADLGLDLTRSWMIGDKVCDLKAGAAAGCRTVLVQTGYGAGVTEPLLADELRLAGVVADLPAAVVLWERSRSL